MPTTPDKQWDIKNPEKQIEYAQMEGNVYPDKRKCVIICLMVILFVESDDKKNMFVEKCEYLLTNMSNIEMFKIAQECISLLNENGKTLQEITNVLDKTKPERNPLVYAFDLFINYCCGAEYYEPVPTNGPFSIPKCTPLSYTIIQ